jgi:pimeloyl-ACP methyl ester carboxylesterase
MRIATNRSTPRTVVCLAVLAFTVALIPATMDGQEPPEWAIGTWAGTLDTGVQQLRIVYDIERGEEGFFVGTMAVPDQGATDIPLDDFRLEGRTLSMSFPVPGGGSYEGELVASGDAVDGIFTQGAQFFPLVLERIERETVRPLRPQEPSPPLAYETEEVSFGNAAAGVELAGTVTVPVGDGPFPGVVLVSGAGAQDRDGTMFGHRPMLVLADHLTRSGVAVLRFDDRGVGGSGGDFGMLTPEGLATDVEAGTAFLAARPSVDPHGVGVAGHSDGALAAAIAARHSIDIAFLIMLAGPGVPGSETAADQAARLARAGGAPDSIVEMNRRLYGELAGITARTAPEDDPDEQLRSAARSAFAELSPELRQRAFGGASEQVVDQLARGFGSPWTRFTVRHDPRRTLEEIRVPVLAIAGEKDLQLPAALHLSAIEGALETGGNPDVTVRSIPGLNHFLQEADSGSPTEFARLAQTISPVVLELMSGWINELVRPSERRFE